VERAGREFEETKEPLGGSKRVKTGHNSLGGVERAGDATMASQRFAGSTEKTPMLKADLSVSTTNFWRWQISRKWKSSASRIRTYNPPVNSRLLYR
jgi:hypothetical protein